MNGAQDGGLFDVGLMVLIRFRQSRISGPEIRWEPARQISSNSVALRTNIVLLPLSIIFNEFITR